MASKILSSANKFTEILRSIQAQKNNDPCIFEEDVQILKVDGEEIALLNNLFSNQTLLLCEKAVPKIDQESNHQQLSEISNCLDTDDDADEDGETNLLQTELGPQPLSINRARQLLSFYILAQNTPGVVVDDRTALHSLWVRCDMSDPAGTTWLGVEMVCTGNKVPGAKLYSVTCKGSSVDKKSVMTLEDVKREHKKRHNLASMVLKGSARFNLFGSTVVENTTIESQSSVTVDFRWHDVESILETPPMSSAATLNIKVASGDMRSPIFEMFRELEFLQSLADGVRTGETEWLEPLETTSAVNLTQAYLEELQSAVKGQDQSRKPAETSVKTEGETPTFNALLERGDLDFIEQLWVRMRKSVTSYQDIGDCLKLVIDALRYSDIKPWIHRDSNSSLSNLILQSYHQKVDCVSLTGLNPVHMLLEMGLDKMRKDYINYLIGEELTTLNHLHYYLSTKVDLQEQVIRLRKLHHLLEIIVTCNTFLGLPYHQLFLLTQSCLQHYKTNPYDENHKFNLPVEPGLISHFYQKEHPVLWGVEVSSGHGPREVKTWLQLSDRPLVDHIIIETVLSLTARQVKCLAQGHNNSMNWRERESNCQPSNYPNETVNGDNEEPVYFSTLVCCSQSY